MQILTSSMGNFTVCSNEVCAKFWSNDQILVKLQVGIGHNFQLQATGWKWKLTTCLGGDGISRIQNKTTLGLCPGVDLRFGWKADYVLPEITGQVP